MTNYVALEWDSREARVVTASQRGREAVIEHAFRVELIPRESGGDVDVGQRVGAALEARGIKRGETLIGVGRTSIELQHLSLPPAPDDELPEMVRFQARQQFNKLADDWPLDFLPLEDDGSGQRVLAATVSPEIIEQIRATCEKAALAPNHLVLRPCAAASLLQRFETSQKPLRLMIDVVADEADLTALDNDLVVLMRTVRLPGEPGSPTQINALVGEVRRTIAAVQNQLSGRRAEHAVLCGGPQEYAGLERLLQSELDLQVERFDPFEGLRLSNELNKNCPDMPGRFAPLLGMILDQAADTPHKIDFLHPRQRVVKTGQRNTLVLASAAVALVVFSLVGMLWWQLSSLDAEVNTRIQDLATLKDSVKTKQGLAVPARAIDNWSRGDVVWLDEMYFLAEQLPTADELRVTELSMRTGPTGGTMTLKGLVKESDVISTTLESDLRDTRHKARGRGTDLKKGDDSRYPYAFSETINVTSHNHLELGVESKKRSTRGGLK